jgi:hypothetical protein
MNARHICIGAMVCLLFLYASCDTMDDVKKMESETDNLTLITLGGGGGGGGGTVCHSGALILNPGGSRTESSSGGQYFYKIPITSPGGNLHVYTSGSAGLTGWLRDTNCSDMASNGDGSAGISMTVSISTAGYYWVEVWISYVNPGDFTIYATYP